MAITSYVGITTSSGGSGVKGAYVQVVASTPYDSSRLYLSLDSAGNTGQFHLADLAKGAAGSEVVIVADLSFQTNQSFICGGFVAITVDIPAGTRLAIRSQCGFGTTSFSFSVYLENRALKSLTNPVTYGTVTASTRGTQIDPGGTANTKGSYVQLTASTTARMDALLVCTVVANPGTTIPSFQTWQVDLATGASGSETIVLPDLHFCAINNANMTYPTVIVLPVSIATGTRLAARAACTSNATTTRIISVTLIGMQDPATTGGGATSVAYLG